MLALAAAPQGEAVKLYDPSAPARPISWEDIEAVSLRILAEFPQPYDLVSIAPRHMMSTYAGILRDRWGRPLGAKTTVWPRLRAHLGAFLRDWHPKGGSGARLPR